MKRQDIINKLIMHRDELHAMGVATLSLFGSVARDEACETSDVDLIVEFNRPIGLMGYARVELFLEQILNVKKVDLVMPDSIYEELRDNILEETVRAF